MFYDVPMIRKVYPDNELVEWVWDAFKEKKELRMKWRDNEMSYEWTDDWSERRAPI